MPTCVVVLKEKQTANDLLEKLIKGSTPLTKYDLVKPFAKENDLNKQEKDVQLTKAIESRNLLQPVSFESVSLLNPKLSQSLRRKTLTFWLMPFGFITGLSFSQMTELTTFSELGFPSQLESLFGGLLGMSAGWIGSFFAAGNPNQDLDDDLRFLQKRSNEGLWLLILETPIEIELPWKLVQESNPKEIVILKEF